MKPAFRILANGQDITAAINTRLLSLTVVDEAGVHSDTAKIELDDRNNAITLPATGAELEIFMGYESTGLVKLGLFTVDEITCSGSPDKITIECRAADMRASLKVQKTRAWDNVTMGVIIDTIANEHGLIPAVSPKLAKIKITHEPQRNESDLHFMTRMSRKHDAVAKPANGHLLYVTRGEAKSASGQQLTSVAVNKSDLIEYSHTSADRGKYNKVLAHWHNTKTGKKEPVAAGYGEPVHTLRNNHADKESAKIAAEAKLASLKRGQAFGYITMSPANTNLMAEGKITLQGFRDEINGDWSCTRVEYTLNEEGLTASADFETPRKV